MPDNVFIHDTVRAPIPERKRPVQVGRRTRQDERTNRAFRGKGIFVNIGDNIQHAIDDCEINGGGTVTLAFGIHVVDYNITLPSFVTLQGEGRDSTRIDFVDQNFQIIVQGVADSSDSTKIRNVRIRDLTVERSSNTTAAVVISYAKHFILDNVRFSDNAGSGIKITASQQYTLINCLADNNVKHGFFLDGGASYNHVSFSLVGCVATNNTIDGFTVDGSASQLTLLGGFISCVSSNNGQDGFEISTGLEARIILSACNANANGQRGFYNDSAVVSYVGCVSRSNTNAGIAIDGVNCAVNGCTSYGNGIQDYLFTEKVAFVGNTLEIGDTTQPSTLVDHLNIAVQAIGNLGGNTITEKRVMYMKNGSGGTIAQGAVVTFKADATGEVVTTTTTQGDDKVFGMAVLAIDDGEYGAILVEGYTTVLKVNGTTDIAIGDLLGTFTTAGIAMKAAAGDMAFAYALEAYATDDSNGVINAVLITPRKL